MRARLDTLNFLSTAISEETPSRSSEEDSHAPMPDYEFDSHRDTCFAHADPAFSTVLHVFNAEYFGIRAAAGNLPGGKLAVSARNKLSPRQMDAVLEQIGARGYDRLVLHGFSDTMADLATRVHKALTLPIFCVWHGNFAQLAYQAERTTFNHWLKLQQDGVVKRAHILKQNASRFLANGYIPLLLNLPPKWKGIRPSPAFQQPRSASAFLPSWMDVRKNWHANMLAAIQSNSIKSIFHYADAEPVISTKKPIHRIRYDLGSHLQVVSTMDIILNVTLIDCHPMVDLEALACGTPTITSRLFLGELDRHPYARLTNVENALDTDEIACRVDEVAGIDPSERTELIKDYSSALVEISNQRYREFLLI